MNRNNSNVFLERILSVEIILLARFRSGLWLVVNKTLTKEKKYLNSQILLQNVYEKYVQNLEIILFFTKQSYKFEKKRITYADSMILFCT